jgi:type I restriction enzyme S subunit
MTSEWREVRLGEVTEIYDGPHATPAKSESGPIFLGISNLEQGRIDLSGAEHVSEDDFKKWTRRVTPEAGDIVFSYETRLGEAARIPAGLRCCLGRRMGLLRAKPGRVDARFLLYAYLGPDFQDTLRRRTVHGSTVDRLPLIDMGEFSLHIPATEEMQCAIAHILGTLDDKIDLLRRMNHTLEETARTLFRSWFVDFDPVRAKAAGREPSGVDADTSKLFPRAFANGELAGVPDGWTRAALGNWVTALSGGTPSKSNSVMWGGKIPWISPKVMKEIHADESDEQVTLEAIGNGTRLAPAGTTLVMVRGMGLHQQVRISQATRDVAFNQDVKALVPRGIESSLLFFALLDAQRDLLTKVESSGHGTGVLATEVLLAHPVTMPTPEIQQKLTVQFDALNARIRLTRRQVRTLSETRDSLLPKLLSGSLRIPDVERFLSKETSL